MAKQTDALVISISQQRETVTVFAGDLRYQLGEISDVLARTNQAVGTLETYKTRLDQGLTRLTALEFQSAVMLDDVLIVLQRAEMTTRMAEEIERNCVELGGEGRLIRMQLDELMEEVPREKAAVVYDYERSGEPAKASAVLERLAELPYPRLLEFEELAEVLGYPRDTNPLDFTVSPRGYRVLSRIPRLPDSVIRHVVRDFARSTPSSGRATEISRRSTASAPCAPARSARAFGGSRSTISSIATCSSERRPVA